ncbi:hypothetical protein PRIPAC_76844, partial [Pristionchus pacificus]|uniref:Uncharacterized protein n=1 Tax=Pristionchus pacificus TaxID=54126 RepID=A0A8R1Y9I2_PRIPA
QLLFAAANYRQEKDVEVLNNGQSSIMFKVFHQNKPVVREYVTVLHPEDGRSSQDRLTAVMAFAMSNSTDVKMLWEKHRKIANQPNSSSRKYIKIDFEDERRMSLARGGPKSAAPKTNISLLTSAYPAPPDEYPPPPPSLPRPSTKVSNSGGRDASITHPNSTKKEQAIRPPSIHPNDLRPMKDVPPPLERLEPSVRTSIPLPPSKPPPQRAPPSTEESKEDEEEAPPPPPIIKSKTLPVKAPPPRKLAPNPPSTEEEESDEVPPTPPVQTKSKIPPLKTNHSRRLPVVSPSQENESIEDETSNLKDVPSLPQKDIPSTTSSGRKKVTDEESTQQQSIVYILYPGGEDKKNKEDADEKDEESKQ